MLKLKYSSDENAPHYMTALSSHCDLKASETVKLGPRQVTAVPTGIWIEEVDTNGIPDNAIPELQIRCRSSFPLKRGLQLANGVGTIDADYRDEIKVLLHNFSDQECVLEKGERIAQMSLGFVYRIPGVAIGGERKGGFGSTGNS